MTTRRYFLIAVALALAIVGCTRNDSASGKTEVTVNESSLPTVGDICTPEPKPARQLVPGRSWRYLACDAEAKRLRIPTDPEIAESFPNLAIKVSHINTSGYLACDEAQIKYMASFMFEGKMSGFGRVAVCGLPYQVESEQGFGVIEKKLKAQLGSMVVIMNLQPMNN